MLNIPSNPPKAMTPRAERSRFRDALSVALTLCVSFDSRTDPTAPFPEVTDVEQEPRVMFTAAVFRVPVRVLALSVLRIRAGGATPDERARVLLDRSDFYRRE